MISSNLGCKSYLQISIFKKKENTEIASVMSLCLLGISNLIGWQIMINKLVCQKDSMKDSGPKEIVENLYSLSESRG